MNNLVERAMLAFWSKAQEISGNGEDFDAIPQDQREKMLQCMAAAIEALTPKPVDGSVERVRWAIFKAGFVDGSDEHDLMEQWRRTPPLRQAAFTKMAERALAAALEAAPVQEGWQPIETYERGSEALIYDPKWGVTAGLRFDSGKWGLATFNGQVIEANPTHWRPRPAPPLHLSTDQGRG